MFILVKHNNRNSEYCVQFWVWNQLNCIDARFNTQLAWSAIGSLLQKKECLSLSQFNCQTTSFDVQSKFQIFPSHSIFLVRNFPPFRVLLLVLCVCVCVSAFFSGHKLLWRKKEHSKKRERTIIVHVSSPFMSRFLLLVLIMKFLPQIWVSCIIFCVYAFFSSFRCVLRMHIFVLITSNKCKEKAILYDLKAKKNWRWLGLAALWLSAFEWRKSQYERACARTDSLSAHSPGRMKNRDGKP